MAAEGHLQEESISRRVVKGTAWVTFGFGSSLVLKLLSSIVMTRFIHPDTYGLMDLVATLIVLLHLFSDIGLLPCIVQSPRGDDPRMVNTIWTMALIRNAAIWLLTAAVAVPIARLYERPILVWIIPTVGAVGVIEALSSPGVFLLRRHLQRGRIVAIELTYSVVTFAATLAAVYFWSPSGFHAVVSKRISQLPFDESLVWTIIIGGYAAQVVATTMTYVLIPGKRPRFELDRQTVREVFGFGRWVLFSSAATFLSQQADRLMVPKISNFEGGGLYGRGMGLVAMATGLIDTLSGTIVFPVVSRIHEQKANVAQALEKVTLTLTLSGSVMLSAMFVAGSSFVHVIYPETYAAVAWIVQLLVFVGWFQFRAGYAGSVLLGLGMPKASSIGSITKLVCLLGLSMPAVYLVKRANAHPLLALIGVVAVGEVFRYVSMLYLMKKQGLWRLSTEVKFHFAMAFLTGLAWLLSRHLTLRLLGGAPTTKLDWFVATLVGGSVVVLLWGLVASVLWRQGKLRLPRKRVPVVG